MHTKPLEGDAFILNQIRNRIHIETALSSSLLYILRTGGVHHSALCGEWTKTSRQPDHFCMGDFFPHQNRPRETSVEVARAVPCAISSGFAPDRPSTLTTSPPVTLR